MAIQCNLQSILTTNTSAGPNITSPIDVYNSTVSVGTLASGPMQRAVTSTPTAVPLSTAPATAVYCVTIKHIGAAGDPDIILDMKDGTGSPNSSKLSIKQGGMFRLYNVSITAVTGTAGNSTWANWTLATASGTTTAEVSIVYT